MKREVKSVQQEPVVIALAQKDNRFDVLNSMYAGSMRGDIALLVAFGALLGLGFVYPVAWYAAGTLGVVFILLWVIQKRAKGQ